MPDNDTSPDHFDWLVDCRSQNQRSTVALYRILRENEAKLARFPTLQDTALGLAGIAFSLWRSVFLSDVSEDTARRSADLDKFLVSLIADNTVLYQTDKNTRNWSFRYYLDHAEYRLEKMSVVLGAAASEKDRWLNAQHALDQAISDFRHAVKAAPHVPHP